ncbi:MAG: hypothetical protein DSY77_13715 [Bacteroidetes bacterium]|nr:MAG: hypothetical protein DSY77_13715 [Bacteroidota bacterium]
MILSAANKWYFNVVVETTKNHRAASLYLLIKMELCVESNIPNLIFRIKGHLLLNEVLTFQHSHFSF